MPGSLVTGATGFLGGHLVEHLADSGLEPHVLHRATSTRPQLEAWENRGIPVQRYESYDDIPAIIDRVRPEKVFHLATHYLKDHTGADVQPLIDANVTFGTHLLDALVGSGATVICAMSYFQFYNGAPRPMSLYSATKQALMDIGDFFRENRGLILRNVVLYDTYGPNDSRAKLVPRLVQAVRDGQPVALGPSQQVLNLLYSDDVSRGFVAASRGAGPATVALRSPMDCTVGDLVSAFGDVAGPLDVSFNDDAPTNDLVSTSGDWPSPEGWSASVGLSEGIRRTIGL